MIDQLGTHFYRPTARKTMAPQKWPKDVKCWMDLLWGFRISGLIYNFGRQGCLLCQVHPYSIHLYPQSGCSEWHFNSLPCRRKWQLCYPAVSKIVPNRAPRDAHSPQGVLSKSKKGALGVYIKILIKYKEGSKLARLKRSKSRREVWALPPGTHSPQGTFRIINPSGFTPVRWR